MRFPLVLLLIAVGLACDAPVEAAPDPAKQVREWVARLRRLERVHPGGRQRDAMKRDAKRLLPPMIEAFADEETFVGRSLARLAALAPPDVAVPLLRAGLDHQNAYVREFSAHALGRIGSTAAIPALTTAVRKSRVSHVEGFGAIAAIGGDSARGTLIDLMTGYSSHFRAGVADALVAFPHPRTIEALTKAVGDEIELVAARSITALARLAELGHHGGPPAVEAIIARLGGKTSELRLAAIRGLEALGGDAAYDALVSHARRVREESFDAWAAATIVRDGPPTAPALEVLVRELGEGRDEVRCRRAARALARATDDESAAALHAVVANPKAPIGLVREAVETLARRGIAVSPDPIRKRLEARADAGRDLVLTLDRAGARDALRSLALAGKYGTEDGAGGPFMFLAFHGEKGDIATILARTGDVAGHPGALADLHLALLAIGGAETVDALVSGLPRLPAEDRIEHATGLALGRRAWCALTLRSLTGRTFGYAADQASGTNRDAFRSALKWWKREGRKVAPAEWSTGAVEAAESHLKSDSPERRENAVEVLARAGKNDAIVAHLTTEKDPAVAVACARALAEADDRRGVEWLITHLADDDLIDPILDLGARPTRREAVRALRRVAQVAYHYEDGRLFGAEEAIDVVIDEVAAWKRWWETHRRRPVATWRTASWAQVGIELGEKPKPATLRRLADLLDTPGVPRWRREGALRELRRATGKSILPIDIVSLERFAPGNDHPVFKWLAPRWRTALAAR